MATDFGEPASPGPGRLLGALSLGCLGAALAVATVAAVMASDILARAPPPGAGGGLQTMLSAGLVAVLAAGAAALCCLVGAVFGLAGLVLAVNHPRGRPVVPAVGLGLNVLPVLALAVTILISLYT